MMPATLRVEALSQKLQAILGGTVALVKTIVAPSIANHRPLCFVPGDRNWGKALRVAKNHAFDMSKTTSIDLEPDAEKGGSDARGTLVWRIRISGKYSIACGSEWYVAREHVALKWADRLCICHWCSR